MKRCSVCKHLRPDADFLKRKTKCRPCRIKYRRKYMTSPEGRMTILARTAKRTARIRGGRPSRNDNSSEVSITPEKINQIYEDQHGVCAISGLPLSFTPHLNTTISLDRVDNSEGYHDWNCQLVCAGINAPRKFEREDVLAFPMVLRVCVAREAAAVARFRNCSIRANQRHM